MYSGGFYPYQTPEEYWAYWSRYIFVNRYQDAPKPVYENLRSDDKFVEDEGWHKANERYQNFLLKNENKKIVFLELGVGYNTPVIIKYPFWQMTAKNSNATYACINKDQAVCPPEIRHKSICINDDISNVINECI